MDSNPAFTVSATALAFRAAMNLNSYYDNRSDVYYLIFDGLTNFMLKWI